MYKKNNNKGFTLVELLVVIAIIGILAVVAVPALFKNIEKGKVADLESDISAIRSAVLSYYADNSDYPVDVINSDKKVVQLKEDMSNIVDIPEEGKDQIASSTKQGTLKLLSELEGLSFPYGGTYELTNADGKVPETSQGTLYLKITTGSKDSTIGSSGLNKLAQDLGLSSITPEKGTNEEQVIKLPLINK